MLAASLSYFDAFVHFTPSVIVLVVSIVVYQTLVPPVAPVDVVCVCCHDQ
jgi:hypothetical protein